MSSIIRALVSLFLITALSMSCVPGFGCGNKGFAGCCGACLSGLADLKGVGLSSSS